jgi:hypothetical protein
LTANRKVALRVSPTMMPIYICKIELYRKERDELCAAKEEDL